jgi:hypothetical protein
MGDIIIVNSDKTEYTPTPYREERLEYIPHLVAPLGLVRDEGRDITPESRLPSQLPFNCRGENKARVPCSLLRFHEATKLKIGQKSRSQSIRLDMTSQVTPITMVIQASRFTKFI